MNNEQYLHTFCQAEKRVKGNDINFLKMGKIELKQTLSGF